MPSPLEEHPEEDVEVQTDVRVRYQGRHGTVTYGFDPCKDVVGWLGDPVIFKLNIWDVPAMGTSRGFMPPRPARCCSARVARSSSTRPPPPFPTTPAPDGSYGAPSHLNDYDEVWLNHIAGARRETEGHVWLLPRTIAHPGIKFPPVYPRNPVTVPPSMKINFDTKASSTGPRRRRRR